MSSAPRIEGNDVWPLDRGWDLAAVEPGAAADPMALEATRPSWIPAPVPGTVASALRANGSWSLDGPPRRFDAQDSWYRCRFDAPAARSTDALLLCFDGLATVADVWLNTRHLLRSENMFTAQDCDVTGLLQSSNELYVRFSSLDALLAARRPRPRWRAPMVENQQLRWFRTSLLGRTPGWSPPAAAVGPWRPVRLERRVGFEVRQVLMRPRVVAGEGLLEIELHVESIGGARVSAGRVRVWRGAEHFEIPCAASNERETQLTFSAALPIPNVALWWPHTHGDQPLYDVSISVVVDGIERQVDCGRTGFRSVELSTGSGDFSFSINGVAVFCRGACWTPLDVVALAAPAEVTREAISVARAAGMNMLRLCGAMVYENDTFYDLCDEQGILIWQDFMFANMDYPDADPAFVAAARAEAAQILGRWQGRPSLALLCGDSEGEQQAVMWGAPLKAKRPFFQDVLPELCASLRPDVPYWPSSASGGAFPHQPNAGTTSYYGVGAYLRPLEDARRSQVRFAAECLAFANVPEERSLASLGGEHPVRVHHAAWKARTPRDLGAGWDFDDVRDYYLGRLFGVDPLALRYADHDRYLELSRVVTGEIMAATLTEWRRCGSSCRGALIWFLRDLWAGAGWGLIDAGGRPKAAYHYVSRALQPVTAFFVDEGLNGLFVHVVNERPVALSAALQVDFYRGGEMRVGGGSVTVALPGHGASVQPVADLLEGFCDTTYAYRFGPPPFELAVATLLDPAAAQLAQAVYFPLGLPAERESDLGLDAQVIATPSGPLELTVRTRRFAQAVALDVGSLVPSDNYFHVPPGCARTVQLRADQGPLPSRVQVKAVNAYAAVSFLVPGR